MEHKRTRIIYALVCDECNAPRVITDIVLPGKPEGTVTYKLECGHEVCLGYDEWKHSRLRDFSAVTIPTL